MQKQNKLLRKKVEFINLRNYMITYNMLILFITQISF